MLPLATRKTFEARGHSLKIQKRYCMTKLRANFFGFRTVKIVEWPSLWRYTISNIEQFWGKFP